MTVDPVGKPCEVLIEILLYVNTLIPVIQTLRMWNGTSTVRESCDLLHENTVFYGVYEILSKALFFKLSILAVCH